MNTTVNWITMYNLDGSLLPQTHLLKIFPHHFIDCHDIRCKNLYCDEEALQQIHTRFLSSKRTPIILIGSGNFHYVTYLHLLDINQPFTLLLFDHHTDLMENAHFLTCGSWVTKALREMPNLKKAIIIGPNPDHFDKIPLNLQDRVILLPDSWDSQKLIHQIFNECDTENVYISIDKDVLDESFSKTNWDHGYLDLNVLIECMTAVLESKVIHHIDICGEWLVSEENSYTPKNQVYIKRNEKTNIAILRALIKVMPAALSTKPPHPFDQAYLQGSSVTAPQP